MKITVINGSPRKDGNTAALVEAFAAGATEAGHTVTVLNVGRKHINGCYACEFCHTKGNGECAQKDDMQEIYPVIKEAEMIVFASPIYYFTLSAQIQAVIQRFYALLAPPMMKKAALIMSSGSPGVYDASIKQYHDLLSYINVEDMGIITAFGDENKSEKKLAEARAFGKSLQ